MANKVEFGISQLHVGTYTVSNGTVTLGTPYHQAGAVSFSPEENSEQNTFYADNIAYWSGYSGGTIEGDLEVAMFDDDFKQNFLGYKKLTSGGLANVKNATLYENMQELLVACDMIISDYSSPACFLRSASTQYTNLDTELIMLPMIFAMRTSLLGRFARA